MKTAVTDNVNINISQGIQLSENLPGSGVTGIQSSD